MYTYRMLYGRTCVAHTFHKKCTNIITIMPILCHPLPQSTDGGMISKARGLVSSSSNVTKSTSALPPATKNTSNKNDEIKIRDNKMKKAGSSTTTIANPKKRLMVEETKGKVIEVYVSKKK